MSRILDSERETYEQIWNQDEYASMSPGEMYLPIFQDMASPKHGATVLDAGCGSGRGTLALRQAGLEVMACDFVSGVLIPEVADVPFVNIPLWDNLWQLPRNFGNPRSRTTFDWVYCCDVLEHIPTPLTMLVIARLLDIAKHGVFLSIATGPDQLGVWVGRPLHQTVEGFVWWRDYLATIGTVVEARDLLNAGLYLVKSK